MMDLVEATLKKPAVGTLRIYADREALARAAAELICETAVAGSRRSLAPIASSSA